MDRTNVFQLILNSGRMSSSAMREIPLKILQGKIGDERVTLLHACYDNPNSSDDNMKEFPHTQHRSGKSQEYSSDVLEDGGQAFSQSQHPSSCHAANDYMHSRPLSRPMPDEITFRAHQKRTRLIILLLACLVFLVTLIIGLAVFFIGHGSSPSVSSLSPPSSPVITLANLHGSLTVIAGPFAVYNQIMENTTSSAYTYIRNGFIFKMDKIFMSSELASLYNKTQITYLSDNNGHVQLTFVIHVQPNTIARSDLLDHVKTVLITGLRDSLFVIDEKSTSLVAMVRPPVPVSTPKPGQCQPVHVAKCINTTEYSSTSFPNLLDHRSPLEVEVAIRQKYEYLLLKPCYGYALDFYCSIFQPECGRDGQPIPPCQKYCQDVMTSCNRSYGDEAPLPLTCAELPDSEDPKVCRQNPYIPGACVPVKVDMCQEMGINHAAYPNLHGGVTLDYNAILFSSSIQNATKCYKYGVLFSCVMFGPPCSGQPYPHHFIPPCASFCSTFRNRCEIFYHIFNQHWAMPQNCSEFPDSPDPKVCVGYHEAQEPEILECNRGEIKCGKDQCIKTSWLCDGFQDCDDNSDESYCATCHSGEQMCTPASNLCIHKSKVCDGASDCYMSVDEHFCVRMDLESGKDVLHVYNSISSEWEEVCQEGWTPAFSEIACKQLGYKKALTTYYIVELKSKKSKIAFLKNGSNPDKLQSYMDKGHDRCSSGYVVKLVCWETECGIRPAYFKTATRVVGGDEVKPGTWPWMVSLHGGVAKKFFCGGTIIHPQWILTAGHCVGEGSKNTTNKLHMLQFLQMASHNMNRTHDTSYWTVKAGNTRRVAYSEHKQVRKVKDLYSYPLFSMTTVENDVALIHLERPLAMNDFVRPICLPEQVPNVGTRCYATGWGKSTETAQGYEPAMRQVSVDVTSWEICKQAIGMTEREVPYKLTSTMFCAGGASDHDACQGDSGGPLVCRKDNITDHWYQGGIVSWGVICGQPNIPGVYTKLPLFINWIHEIIANYSYPGDDSFVKN